MTDYSTQQPRSVLLQAARALEHLYRVHAEEFRAEDEFRAADRSICPELYHEPEPLFRSTGSETGDKLLIATARAFGLNPVALDDAIIARDWEEQGRQAARTFASAGVCVYWLRGLECRNAPMDRPGSCGCRRPPTQTKQPPPRSWPKFGEDWR